MTSTYLVAGASQSPLPAKCGCVTASRPSLCYAPPGACEPRRPFRLRQQSRQSWPAKNL